MNLFDIVSRNKYSRKDLLLKLIINLLLLFLVIILILDDTFNSTADINSDGTLNVQDAIIIINIILSI